jgi:phosphatidate phosphatase APP1
MVRRFASDEIPFARVRARFAGHELEAVADEEGFFDLCFELVSSPDSSTVWHPVEVELLWPEETGVRATGSVLVPAGARFGVISDLDDTVVRSNVTSFLKMAQIVLLNNAHTRLPFEGVASFYHALQRGEGQEFNPIFYVSSSPWNLYDLLEDFLDVHGVPAGPLFLKDWSPTTMLGHEKHKLGVIRMLLATYPELPFVLIGDSGENDPEIYHKAVREHPGRIRAIYIRDVATKERDAAVHAIAREVRSLGVEMLLVPDTVAAAEHAAQEGLITPDALPDVRRATTG